MIHHPPLVVTVASISVLLISAVAGSKFIHSMLSWVILINHYWKYSKISIQNGFQSLRRFLYILEVNGMISSEWQHKRQHFNLVTASCVCSGRTLLVDRQLQGFPFAFLLLGFSLERLVPLASKVADRTSRETQLGCRCKCCGGTGRQDSLVWKREKKWNCIYIFAYEAIFQEDGSASGPARSDSKARCSGRQVRHLATLPPSPALLLRDYDDDYLNHFSAE